MTGGVDIGGFVDFKEFGCVDFNGCGGVMVS